MAVWNARVTRCHLCWGISTATHLVREGEAPIGIPGVKGSPGDAAGDGSEGASRLQPIAMLSGVCPTDRAPRQRLYATVQVPTRYRSHYLSSFSESESAIGTKAIYSGRKVEEAHGTPLLHTWVLNPKKATSRWRDGRQTLQLVSRPS